MNRILNNTREEIENILKYTNEHKRIINEAKIYDTFTTENGMSYQINSISKKHGIIFCVVVNEKNNIELKKFAINLI